MTRILVIDNYDSFVYTLGGYLQQLGASTEVIRNDAVSVGELEQMLGARGGADGGDREFDGVLVSPGPGTPADAGISIPMVRIALRTGIPLLGVCLGHQAIAEAMGATVTHADELMHGKVSRVRHSGDPFFEGVADEFDATRYHSLAVVRSTVPEELRITAETAQGIVMALRHRDLPIYGVQYHPESVLTEGGYRQLGNWLGVVGSPNAAAIAATLSPLLSVQD
ncbi:anthranilate synthase component II [Leucobacter soli]|uniref:Anthranilate synthase component 2 n=1 Tax=Leucobacter soli TaxID=2812850 RepID=A0A916JW06_9MICO|nr:gamma-glutamyl-gamma-aminobutyrate hydrolase family protein [Leucobacter soli]CAG7607963.1 Anthranilate synthase component 2 [Leucobacter soli]